MKRKLFMLRERRPAEGRRGGNFIDPPQAGHRISIQRGPRRADVEYSLPTRTDWANVILYKRAAEIAGYILFQPTTLRSGTNREELALFPSLVRETLTTYACTCTIPTSADGCFHPDPVQVPTSYTTSASCPIYAVTSTRMTATNKAAIYMSQCT